MRKLGGVFRLAFLLAACAAFPVRAAVPPPDGAATVESWLDDAGALWSLTPETFLDGERAPLFAWLANQCRLR